jgi:hypothetical protein
MSSLLLLSMGLQALFEKNNRLTRLTTEPNVLGHEYKGMASDCVTLAFMLASPFFSYRRFVRSDLN